MYEGDTPNAERRAAALSLDRDLLRELLGQEELRELIDPAALDQVEADLQHRSERTRAATRDELGDVLRRIGDLTAAEVPTASWPGATRPGCWPSSRASDARSGCGWAARSAGSRPTTPASTATRSAPCRPAGCPRPSSADVERRRSSESWRATRAPTGRSRRASYRPGTASIRRAPWPRSSATASSSAGSCGPAAAARVVRHGRPAAPAPRLAGRAAQGDRGRRRPRAGDVPAELAGRRPPSGRRGRRRPPARGARPAAGPGAPGRGRGSATSCRAAAAPTRPRGWTSSARAARSCGSAPGALGRNSGRVALYFRDDAEALGAAGRPTRAEPPPSRRTTLLRERLAQAPCFFTDFLAELAARARGDPGGAVGPGVGRAR